MNDEAIDENEMEATMTTHRQTAKVKRQSEIIQRIIAHKFFIFSIQFNRMKNDICRYSFTSSAPAMSNSPSKQNHQTESVFELMRVCEVRARQSRMNSCRKRDKKKEKLRRRRRVKRTGKKQKQN